MNRDYLLMRGLIWRTFSCHVQTKACKLCARRRRTVPTHGLLLNDDPLLQITVVIGSPLLIRNKGAQVEETSSLIREIAGVPHHLIDVLDPLSPNAEFSAGDFHDSAHAAAAEIVARGRTPIVVGGTGFYVRMFMMGKAGGGKPSPEVEARAAALVKEARRMEVAVASGASEDEEGRRWETGVNILRELGDSEGAYRYNKTCGYLDPCCQSQVDRGCPIYLISCPI
jgi:hypothetical protein